jgi:hypothetical protein
MRNLLIAGIVFTLIGCATNPIEHVALSWRLVDHPEKSRIELFYRNDTGKTLCLSDDDWPNAEGKLNQMDDVVFLVVGSERFPIAYYEQYCPTGCSRRVIPGEEISAFIPYADFQLPERLRYEPKTLEFHPQAYVCR